MHELALFAAMQEAVNDLLAALSPAKLRAAGDGSRLPFVGDAQAFKAYEALHAATLQALTDDFDSIFGKAFARTYERVSERIDAASSGEDAP